jgi:hypothetical protein
MKPPARCPRCGRKMPVLSSGGVCSECLLGLALQPERGVPLRREPELRIPKSLARAGARRMGWVGLALALSGLGILITGYYLQPGWVNPATAPLSYSMAVLGVALSGLALFTVARCMDATPALDAGLVLQVVAGFFISLAENSIPHSGLEPIRGNSSVAVWITVFALAVPVSYGKALIAALATASMGPIGLGIQILSGNVPNPQASLWFVLFSTVYLMAASATVLGRLIYRLGAEVKAAREYGGYELVSLLGSGGMGEVWKARHHLIGREAAVKLIRPEIFQTQSGGFLAALRRFDREANATAALHSPHTVSLYNYGLSDDGLLYYVMELLEGYDLQTLVARFGPISANRAIYILTQVCDSLAEAHEAGLIHRDIKPGNILLCRMGVNCDFAKVVDFGIVQLTDPVSSKLVTRSIVGTPAYVAPEVLAGEIADARVDIYGLGCVAYWLLCGSTLAETPQAPSMRTKNVIPRRLESIIMASVEKDPARRPQSVRDLSFQLHECGSDRPWTHLDAERWWTETSPRPV